MDIRAIPIAAVLLEAAEHPKTIELCPASFNAARYVLALRLRNDPAFAFRALFEEWTLEDLVKQAY